MYFKNGGHWILSSVLSVIGGSGIISDSEAIRSRTCSSNNKGAEKGNAFDETWYLRCLYEKGKADSIKRIA